MDPVERGYAATVMQQFPPNGTGVRAARNFVARHLASLGLDADDASLVVSELAANAALHATSDFTVGLDVRGPCVRIEVSDHSSVLPVLKDHGQHAPTGRGLKIVERLSASWGADPTQQGKTVWAVLDPVAALVADG